MKITIYGSRGSIARSHPDLRKYGGNTPCVEVTFETTRIVLDMGSGAYDLGQKLVKQGPLRNQHVLLTHSHWDHIQGYPFFAPLFVNGSQWNIYAPGGFSSSLKDKLSSQMSHEFFPLSLEELEQFGAEMNFMELREGALDLGDIHVTTQYINHTVLTLGYRLYNKKTGKTMAYITDHEMFNQAYANGYKRTEKNTPDDRHADFFAGVDLLIHDSQYLAKEYAQKAGFGHGTVEYVVDMAMSVGVKKLALFHHDPNRTDDEVDEILLMSQERVLAAGSTLEVIAASDFMTLELKADPGVEVPEAPLQSSWALATQPKFVSEKRSINSEVTALTEFVNSCNQEVVISHSNRRLFDDLTKDGLRVTHINEDTSLLQSLPDSRPSLLLVSYEGEEAGENVIEHCQSIRECRGCWGKNVPYIVSVKNQETLEELRDSGNAVGITDWVVEPFSPAYIRTRIRMEISRHPCKWKPPLRPRNEEARMGALRALQILDSPPEDRFDRITKLCSKVFAVPIVFISLVDENRQWFKSTQWSCPILKPGETSREVSFCGHAILQNDVFMISDATQDDRFAQNPLVTEGPKIRFYAGVPLSLPNVSNHLEPNFNVGTLCIIDQRPRELDDSQVEMLKDFAEMVKSEILTFASRKMHHQLIESKTLSRVLSPQEALGT